MLLTGTDLIPLHSYMAGKAVNLLWKVTAEDELDDILSELLYSGEDKAETVYGGSRP